MRGGRETKERPIRRRGSRRPLLSTIFAANPLDTRPFFRATFEYSINTLHKNLPASTTSNIFRRMSHEMTIRVNLQKAATVYSMLRQNHISVNCSYGTYNFNSTLNFIFELIFDLMYGRSMKLKIQRRICSCYY